MPIAFHRRVDRSDRAMRLLGANVAPFTFEDGAA